VTSPDTFVDTYQDSEDKLEEMLKNISDINIKFQQWKRVKHQNGKVHMRIVENHLTKTKCMAIMKDEFAAFVTHVERVVQH